MRPIERLRELATQAARVSKRDVPRFRELFDQTLEEAGATARPGEQRELWELCCRIDDSFEDAPRRGPIRPFCPDLPPRVRAALAAQHMETENAD